MGLDVPQPAVLYTSQSLTSAQAGQAAANLSNTLGIAGELKFVDGYGLTFFATGTSTVKARIWYETAHPDELHIDSGQSIVLGPNDGSQTNFRSQLTSASGAGGGGYVYLGREGVPSGGATLKDSQFQMWNSAYWNGAAIVYTGFNLRSTALDTSGNVAATFAADNTNGNVTNAMQVRVPAGTITFPGIAVGTTAGKGIWAPDSTHLQIQAATNDSGRIYLGGNHVICGPDDRFRTGYADSASAPALQIYYENLGFGVVSASELYLTVNGAKALQFKTTGIDVFAAGQSTVAKLGGTLYSTTTAVGNVGTGEDDLDSYTVPANTLQASGDAVVCSAAFTFAAASTNSMRFRGYFGGVSFWDTTALAVTAGTLNLTVRIQRTGATSQLITVMATTNNTTVSAVVAAMNVVTTGARDNTASQILKFTATLTDGGGGTANDQGVQNQMTVQFQPTP